MNFPRSHKTSTLKKTIGVDSNNEDASAAIFYLFPLPPDFAFTHSVRSGYTHTVNIDSYVHTHVRTYTFFLLRRLNPKKNWARGISIVSTGPALRKHKTHSSESHGREGILLFFFSHKEKRKKIAFLASSSFVESLSEEMESHEQFFFFCLSSKISTVVSGGYFSFLSCVCVCVCPMKMQRSDLEAGKAN